MQISSQKQIIGQTTTSIFELTDLRSFLTRSINQTDINVKKKIRKRFNTTPSQFCHIDHRIKTFYLPNQQYKFTGSCFKKQYKSEIKMMDMSKCKTEENIKIIDKDKQKIFKIKNPAPTRQPEFIMKIKKSFLKKHSLIQKRKNASDLIRIQDFLTEKKQKYKRTMVSELINQGQAKLLSQIKQRKGKIYLEGLHKIKKKKQNIQHNFDRMLVKSRNSFSTPNKYIAHLKLHSEKTIKKFSLVQQPNSLLVQ